MIRDWEEIYGRYDAIKNTKLKTNKKLTEMGEILSSAYKLLYFYCTAKNLHCAFSCTAAEERFDKYLGHSITIDGSSACNRKSTADIIHCR